MLLAVLWILPGIASAQQPKERLLDRLPFDRIRLDAANGNAVLDVMLLDLPNRQNFSSIPTSGSLKIRRLNEPSVPYEVTWSSIAKVELFEQLLLQEAIRLIAAKDFNQGYEYLSFLKKNYPTLIGLQQATEKYLIGDAGLAYADKRYEEAIAIMLSLYDLNPRRKGLERVVQAVGDRLISDHLANGDFASARNVLKLLKDGFPRLEVASIPKWQQRFEADANQQLLLARQAIQKGDFQQARRSVQAAVAVLPGINGAKQIMKEINRLSPRIIVGVSLQGMTREGRSQFDWPAARIAPLVSPRFVELSDFGAEGGIYTCDWASFASDDSGLEMEIRLNSQADFLGITPELIALKLLNMANPASEDHDLGIFNLLQDINIQSGNTILVNWQSAHVRPETLLQLPLPNICHDNAATVSYQPIFEPEQSEIVRYVPSDQEGKKSSSLTIIERDFSDEDEALGALQSGEIDILDNVAPWQLDKLRELKDIVVETYRLPTLHVLIPNYNKPLMARREFRRALAYGIDRETILTEMILGGEKRTGFSLISAPLPKGVTSSDPIGYAYNLAVKPRPYEPRLAAVLATLARNSLAKQAAATSGENNEQNADAKQTTAPEKPLILLHPPTSLARTVCQSIKLQLTAIGISIQLKEIPPNAIDPGEDYDLLYADLTVWEPLVDASRLMGPTGKAGHCTAAMSLALRSVELARNWKEVTERFRSVHQTAHNDLPMIPLWQTINYFAYRKNVSGIGSTPVSLYQDARQWTLSVGEGY